MNGLKRALRLFSQSQDRTNGLYSSVQSQMSSLISAIDGLDPASLSVEQKKDLEVFMNRMLVPRVWRIIRP